MNKRNLIETPIIYDSLKLEVLRKASNYNYSENRFIPEFTFESQDSANLKRVRKELKLDSIAGKKGELFQIFNLMNWVHNLINHDGKSSDPTLKNAIDLSKVSKEENRGMNCRMLAITLNECYLSMGIKSKYVTCMPRETIFDDCHVINSVYSNDLKKWIWIDPTYAAYVMDEKGELLGIHEVRERLIKEQPLVLNKESNWNNKRLLTKEEYLDYYMAKNLYRLQSPLVSEYDSETWKKGKEITYLELLPLDGIEQTPEKKEMIDKNIEVKFIDYKTNNPDLFFAKPE